MNRIRQSANRQRWPRQRVASVKTRPRDLVLRITDWTDDTDEPGYDVEVYVGGVYDWTLSESHTRHQYTSDADAKRAAIAFAQKRIKELV